MRRLVRRRTTFIRPNGRAFTFLHRDSLSLSLSLFSFSFILISILILVLVLLPSFILMLVLPLSFHFSSYISLALASCLSILALSMLLPLSPHSCSLSLLKAVVHCCILNNSDIKRQSLLQLTNARLELR